MALRDLRTFAARPTLDLPIGGKTYSVPEPDAATGAWLQQIMWIGEDAVDARDEQAARDAVDETDRRILMAMLTDAQEESLYRRALGPIWDEMLADGVSFSEAKHAGLTTAIWTVYGLAMAEQHWERGDAEDTEGGDDQGEASTPDKPDSLPASGGAESGTRTQGSGSGTRASNRARRKPGRRGGTSSSSGSSSAPT